jgi:hypothetical protein
LEARTNCSDRFQGASPPLAASLRTRPCGALSSFALLASDDDPHLESRTVGTMTSTAAALLMDRLGLTEDELCAALDVDPLTVITGELDHKPQLPILLALTEEASERVAAGVLPRWVRSSGPTGRPIDHLLGRDYAAFEDDLQALADRGFVLRAGR